MLAGADGLPEDHWSARWTGALVAPASGTYTIAVETDDGVRVWVGGDRVIDDWHGHYVTRNEAEVELVNLRVAAVEPGPEPRVEAATGGALRRASRRAWFDGEWLEAEVLRGEPGSGETAAGPCIFELPEATLVLPPGWSAEVDEAGTIKATDTTSRPRTRSGGGGV